MANPFLSIVIPAFNEEKRLPDTLEQVYSFIKDQPFESEVLIVENGSTDRTLEESQEFSQKHEQFHVLEVSRGKGLAIRRGMLEAKGEYCFMCDADLSMPIAEIRRFLPPVLTGFDLAIGSREAEGAKRFGEPAYRHLGGRLINLLIRLLALPGMHDTQCGFKCFHYSVVRDLFEHQTMGGWSFDIELLYIARLRGYRVLEVPIPWYFNPESKLNVIQDAFRMASDIMQIRHNARNGTYEKTAVQASESLTPGAD
ncbi:MAG: glycosyl transferase [Chloroflexi bacterium RBG_16_54_18]|nr:MAG: glycosyl transferase [Chloroflexi bacterium RBG_16_54_18]